MTNSGACLCGLVSYEVSGPLLSADNCHCSMCRRQHGAAYATYADVIPEDFRWTAGKEQVKVYEVESGGGWCFCTECGSTLAGTLNGVITSVTLGTISGEVGIEPQCHIFVDSRASWHRINDSLPQFAQRQGGEER